MKTLFVLIAIVALAVAQSDITMVTDERDAAQEVFGFLEGFVSSGFSKRLSDVTPCLKDSKAILLDIDNAVRAFTKGTHGIVKGLTNIGDFFTKMVPVLSECPQCPKEVIMLVKHLQKDFSSNSKITKMSI
jgi:hypothetical protein